jgi:hypothetical protein
MNWDLFFEIGNFAIGAVCLLAGIVLGLWLKGCKPSSPAKPIEVIRYDTIWAEKRHYK